MKRNQLNDFPFFEYIRDFYLQNKGKIRNRYKLVTKKFLDYNDSLINENAYLRKPQFEALEMYVFLKEFMDNKQIYEIFAEWFNSKGVFSESRFITSEIGGQISFFDESAINYEKVFNLMKKSAETYPNYIFALAMGLGKTKLIATSIFYEFLLASKFPKDKKYIHNALVFAPDKTVLNSLDDIQTFDKSLVVPDEYANFLTMNIKFHYLDDTSSTLNIIDGSSYNIVISNTQKIIIKKRRKEKKPVDKFFNMDYNSGLLDDDMNDFIDELHKGAFNELKENAIEPNQRYQKITRLTQLGIYVDEAHHLFGTNLLKDLKAESQTSLRYTINQLAKQLEIRGTQLVACFNYTGTPYVNNLLLPEVVYYYGLDSAINNEYLKKVTVSSFDNVKNNEFIEETIEIFFKTHKNHYFYEELLPKIAIYGATVDEVVNTIKPIVENKLDDLGISRNCVLVNVGDSKYTKEIDERDFKNLDKPGTDGSKKQVILLVNKGKEGWDCRSLFSVALFRSPKSKVFVLQSTMRALRQISDTQQQAHIFLSRENYEILDDELKKNYNIDTAILQKSKPKKTKIKVSVRPISPMKKIKINDVKYSYELIEKNPVEALNFNLSELNLDEYKPKIYKKEDLMDERLEKQSEIKVKSNIDYSLIMLTSEVAKYLNMSPLMIHDVLQESVDGKDYILDLVSMYNKLIYNVIIPKIFYYYYDIKETLIKKAKEVELLTLGFGKDYLEYQVEKDLLINFDDMQVVKFNEKSFHTDKYCFDSRSERLFFIDFLKRENVKEIYFTGMFTGQHNNVSIKYIDPETNSVRMYYPDFIIVYEDGTYELSEVKGDHQIDDLVVKAKKEATEELLRDSNMVYKVIPSSTIK